MSMVSKSTNFRAATSVAALLFLGTSFCVHAQDADTVYQLQALLEEVRELRGQVESQQVEIENLRRRQRDQYLDLDQRLQALGRQAISPETEGVNEAVAINQDTETTPASGQVIGDVPEVRAPIETRAEIITLAMPASGGERALAQPTEIEQAAYEQAFRALREARYVDAADQFNAFVDQYPDSSYAPNAFYWLAETYYVTRDFETARDLFANVLERYPNSSKAGDALLKLGFSYFELQQWPEARSALEQVRAEHPETTLSRLAESRLRDMRLSGRF